VGSIVPFGFYTNAQTLEDGYGTGKQKPVRSIGIKVVGIVTLHFQVVRDDVDRSLRAGLFSPALTRPLNNCCANGPIVGLQLDHGNRDEAAVASEIKALPRTTVIHVAAV